MNIAAPLRTRTAGLLLWLVFSLPLLSLAAQQGPRSEAADFDCATLALHSLFAIEGRSIAIDAVRRLLPPLDPRGYSLAELRNAARAGGLDLDGVTLVPGDRAPDRPAIVFFDREGHGHYAVVRPVGHSGKLIQIIDAAEGGPIVMDAKDLYASSQWTGLALLPRRPNWPFRLATGGAIVSCLTLVAVLFAMPILSRRFGQRRPVSLLQPPNEDMAP